MNGKIYALHPIGEPNNIRYIGKCSPGNLKARLSCHKSEARKDKKSLRKNNWIKSLNYKIDIKELYCCCSTLDELNNKEIQLIQLYKNSGHNLTNLTKGGDGNSYSTLDRNHAARKIIQYNLKGDFVAIFNSMKEGEIKTGVKAELISGCICMDRIKSAGGYIWTYFKKNYPKKISPYKKGHGGGARPKNIEATNITTGELHIFSSINLAAKNLGIHKQNITYALKSKNKVSKGYNWRII